MEIDRYFELTTILILVNESLIKEIHTYERT